MNDLAEFLLARIAEDEAVAREATPGPWYWEEPSKDDFPQSDESLMSRGKQDDGFDVAVLTGWGYDASGINGEQADRDHIARHDPARVLAESEAKRRIVREHAPIDGFPACPTCTRYDEEDTTVTAPCPTLRALALPYADHPDYRQEWRP